VGVIDHGKLLVVEQTSRLLDRLGRRTLRVVPVTEIDAANFPAALTAIGVTRDAEGALVFPYLAEDRDAVPRLLAALAAAGVSPRDLSSARPSLEQVFMDLVKPGAAS
jgi:ABC-2 type transport system ATP-binding protein